MVEDRMKVVLRVWGLTDWDANRGRQDATLEAAERGWEIVDVTSSTGHPNPLRPRDYSALRIGEASYRMWTFYKHAPESGDEGHADADADSDCRRA